MRDLKSERSKRKRAHREAARVSVTVNARDALWAIDATHLGRDECGGEVQAEIVRELASTRTIDFGVGPPANSEDVIRLLDRCVELRGTAPLVLLSDNGPPYIADLLAQWCRAHKVIHLLNLPYTPQHNGACEHGMRDLKWGAGLGKGALVLDTELAREALEQSRDRVDGNRLRATRGWKTAVGADQRSPPWWTLLDREELYREITCAIENALLNSTGKRAQRVATRAAILDTLQHFSVITRTRGGRVWTAQNAEDDS